MIIKNILINLKAKIVLSTIISIILSWYISVLAHEFAHSTMAWYFGYIISPTTIKIDNWLLFTPTVTMLAEGNPFTESFIVSSGLMMTTILLLLSWFFLHQQFIQKNTFLVSFFFWLAIANLMEIFSYIPNRVFSNGDIWEIIIGLNISPLWIFIPGVVMIVVAIYLFYRYEVITMFKLLPIESLFMQRVYLWLTFWPLIVPVMHGQKSVLIEWELLSSITNIASLILVVIILFVFDPAHKWVKETIKRQI